MSQIRVYRNGRPAWLELEPATARRQGFGGSAMGHFSGVVLTAPTIRRDADIARQKRRAETKRLWREANPDMRRGRVRQ